MIDEAWCIGCTLCIKACPVDCIVGAPKLMHTVIDDAVHRLRAVRAGLPGRLHRAGRRDAARAPAGHAWSAGAGRRRRASATRCHRQRVRRDQRENDERLAAKAQAKLDDLRDRRRSPTRSARAQARASREAAHAARDAQRRDANCGMKRADIEPFFATLRAANPAARRPSSSTASVFELLVAVLLSAQATDVERQQGDAAPVRASPTRRSKMLALGEAGADRAHQDHRPVPQQGEEPDRDLPHPRRASTAARCRARARRSRPCPASAARPPTWCSTWPSASRRWRSTRTSFASPTAPAWRRARRRSRSSWRCSSACPRPTCADAHHWLILHGRYVCQARKPLCCAVPAWRRGATSQRRRRQRAA